MNKMQSRALWATGGVGLVAGVLWYMQGHEEPASGLGPSGAVRIEVSVGDPSVHALTATITGSTGFQPQTHQIKVPDGRPVSTTLIGGLPVAGNYEVALEGGSCRGSSTFDVEKDRVAQVSVRLNCASKMTASVAFTEPEPNARCGDNRLNQQGEECDGKALPASAPAGARCSSKCTIILADEENKCAKCSKDRCSEQRTALDAVIGKAAPIVECVLGKDWREGARAPVNSCANNDLMTCYCGSMPAETCAFAPPSSVPGPCVAEVLAATDCETSLCVAGQFMRAANPNGIAMQYIQCTQDMCNDECVN